MCVNCLQRRQVTQHCQLQHLARQTGKAVNQQVSEWLQLWRVPWRELTGS